MKYIKKFKESKEEYYVPYNMVSISLTLDKYAVHISNNSIQYITKLLPVFTYSFIRQPLHRDSEDKNTHYALYLVMSGEKWKIYINELEDEYFLLHLIELGIPADSEDLIFKCDQLGGVRELLEDLKII